MCVFYQIFSHLQENQIKNLSGFELREIFNTLEKSKQTFLEKEKISNNYFADLLFLNSSLPFNFAKDSDKYSYTSAKNFIISLAIFYNISILDCLNMFCQFIQLGGNSQRAQDKTFNLEIPKRNEKFFSGKLPVKRSTILEVMKKNKIHNTTRQISITLLPYVFAYNYYMAFPGYLADSLHYFREHRYKRNVRVFANEIFLNLNAFGIEIPSANIEVLKNFYKLESTIKKKELPTSEMIDVIAKKNKKYDELKNFPRMPSQLSFRSSCESTSIRIYVPFQIFKIDPKTFNLFQLIDNIKMENK